MKIKHSLNVIILVGILLFSMAFLGAKPVEAQSSAGVAIKEIPLDFVSSNVLYNGNTSLFPKAYRHYFSQPFLDLFTSNVVIANQHKYLALPMPVVLRNFVTVTNTQSTLNIDDELPDSIYTGGISNTPDFPKSYVKQCGTDPVNGPQSSVIFYVKLQDLIGLNQRYASQSSLLDSNNKNFSSSQLSSQNPLSTKIIIEYCYNNEILFNDNRTINSKKYPRRVIGNTRLQEYNVYPPKLGEGQNQFITTYFVSPTTFSSPDFTQLYPTSKLNEGYRYGEFQVVEFNNPLNCQIDKPLMQSDIFGNKIIGVDTALGCLPGSFEGIFAIVLRISVGISAAALLILIILNGISLMQSNNSPDAIKKIVSNISRGIGALIIIIFAVFFLNLVGIKILDLETFGSIGIQQIVGQ